MDALMVKSHFVKILFITLITTFGFGCNFFGKQKDQPTEQNSGQFSNGTSVIGNWTFNYATTSDTRNPTNAFTETYNFDPAGNVRLELKDPHTLGISCTGYGVYKIVDNDVIIFMQATSSPMCGFNSTIKLNEVEVTPNSLKFHDEQLKADLVYFPERANTVGGPVGLWDFHGTGADESGDGGIDWILFDSKGYFLLQTRFTKKMYLLMGFYTMNPVAGTVGGISLTFFGDDPSQISGAPMVFAEMLTNVTQVKLTAFDQNGNSFSYIGDKL